MALDDWERSFAVNARGHFLVAREAMRVLIAQGLGGALVFIATKNVMAPGKDFADALLSAWLGPEPVSGDLKRQLLGG